MTIKQSLLRKEKMQISKICSTLLKNKTLDQALAKVWGQRVMHCDKYSQFFCYKQNICFLLSQNPDDLFMFHSNAYTCEYLQHQADLTYKECKLFNDSSWSLSNDEGTLIGYISAGERIIVFENRRRGKSVSNLEMVLPYGSDHHHLVPRLV